MTRREMTMFLSAVSIAAKEAAAAMSEFERAVRKLDDTMKKARPILLAKACWPIPRIAEMARNDEATLSVLEWIAWRCAKRARIITAARSWF